MQDTRFVLFILKDSHLRIVRKYFLDLKIQHPISAILTNSLNIEFYQLTYTFDKSKITLSLQIEDMTLKVSTELKKGINF